MWWRDFVELRHDCVGVDTPIVLNPGGPSCPPLAAMPPCRRWLTWHAAVWRASGHVDNFTDPLVECKTCQHRARADKLVEDRGEVAPQDLAALGALVQQLGVPCPSCGARDAFTGTRPRPTHVQTAHSCILTNAHALPAHSPAQLQPPFPHRDRSNGRQQVRVWHCPSSGAPRCRSFS